MKKWTPTIKSINRVVGHITTVRAIGHQLHINAKDKDVLLDDYALELITAAQNIIDHLEGIKEDI
jgi:hypothetical protein